MDISYLVVVLSHDNGGDLCKRAKDTLRGERDQMSHIARQAKDRVLGLARGRE